MASLNISICDLCKKMVTTKLDSFLTLQMGKGKDKEVSKVEICNKCYDNLLSKINSEFDVNRSFSHTRNEISEIGEGESIVPSNVDNVAQPVVNSCPHDSTSYDPPYLKCKDCGEEWKAS